jgi:uncharacterized protein (DUF885 family)
MPARPHSAKSLGRVFLVLLVLPLSPLTVPAASPPPSLELQALGKRVYETLWEFHPVDGTYQGFHNYDNRLGRYTSRSVAEATNKLRDYLREAEKLDPVHLSPDDQIDRELLLSNLKMELFRLENLKAWERNPKVYADECVGGVYYLLLRNFASLQVRAKSAAQRMAEVPRVLEDARKNVKDPPRIYVFSAIEELKTGEEFYAQTARDLGEQFPELKKDLSANSAKAIQAMRAYREELEKSLSSLKDDFAMGKENYDYLLKTAHFLPFDSDSLLRLGERMLAWSDSLIKVQQKAKEAYDKAHPQPPEPFVPAPRDFSKKDLLAYDAREIDSMRAWVRDRHIATVPDYVGRLEVMEIPTFLRGIIPGIAMEPPAPLDSVQTSYFYIRPIPEPLDSARRQKYFDTVRRRGFKGGVVHEGYPGHHLQLSLANHHSSFLRRMQYTSVLGEGWALYCEQMVVEQGLYPDDGFPDLHWLGGVNFRAARVIVDAKVHTGQMTYDQAWSYFDSLFGPDTAWAKGEVRRYCLEPGQPMSYLVGKTQILALREEYQRKMGRHFAIQDFHDRLLAEGSIPLSLIRRKLLAP